MQNTFNLHLAIIKVEIDYSKFLYCISLMISFYVQLLEKKQIWSQLGIYIA